MTLPDWAETSISTGLTALLGFLFKYGWDYCQERKELQKERIKKLETLKGLLEESGNLFEMQNKLLRRLVSTMSERIDVMLPSSHGYEAFISEYYDHMNDNERDMHSIVRGTTMNSMKIVNQEMLKWLKEDGEFKINSVKYIRDTFGDSLSTQLNKLELHLNLWKDKYTVWMENDSHCVVYLDDEEQHGAGFPKGIELVVDLCLKELSKHSS